MPEGNNFLHDENGDFRIFAAIIILILTGILMFISWNIVNATKESLILNEHIGNISQVLLANNSTNHTDIIKICNEKFENKYDVSYCIERLDVKFGIIKVDTSVNNNYVPAYIPYVPYIPMD